MEDAKMNKWWIQTIITLILVVSSVSIAWGAYSVRVNGLETSVNDIKKDHDLLVALNIKTETILKNIDEMKVDLKKHLERP